MSAHPNGRRPILVVGDLDRTLIYSRGALLLPEGKQRGLVGVERHHGKVESYMTKRSAADLAELKKRALFVPTTTRTKSQFDRVDLPGPATRFSIIANGATVLENGLVDATWAQAITRLLSAHGVAHSVVQDHIEKICHPDFTLKIRSADGIFSYLVVDRQRLPDDFMSQAQDWARPRGWSVSRQGRKIYWIPEGLGKQLAVRAIAERIGAGWVVAAGDSALDVAMLNEADAAIRPAHGDLDPAELKSHVVCTERVGALAGEEITSWLLDLVRLH